MEGFEPKLPKSKLSASEEEDILLGHAIDNANQMHWFCTSFLATWFSDLL